MSKIKVGDKVRVVNVGKEFSSIIGKISTVTESNYGWVYLDIDGQAYRLFEKNVEIVGNEKVKMLHELITLAKAGVKFRAKSIAGGPWCYASAFYHASWTPEEITTHWQYEEIKEPRVVEFNAHWDMTCPALKNILKQLDGARWKIVATEVVE